jgi:hypothetical protein
MVNEKPNGISMRTYAKAKMGMGVDLGPLSLLPGDWKGAGTGWNMIALPFKDAPTGTAPFRILMNQYDEDLKFTFVDDKVPNRGVAVDQEVATLDYQQSITQQVAEDFPASTVAGPAGHAIHHEPGLWIHVKNHQTEDINVARLASIPHGNSLLALGHSSEQDGMPDIPPINALPIGRFEDLATPGYDFNDDPYLEPYKHYIQNPFMGNVVVGGFPGFNPRDMNEILRFANQGVDIKRTTTLTVDTKREDAGVVNMPFVVKEAEPVSMKSTFWIQELNKKAPDGYPKLRMQYSQVVMLDFFRPREDQLPGRAQWPHVSINTLEKVYY